MNPEDKHQFIAVYGQSGTGKSHLIRWFAARYEQNKPTDEVVPVSYTHLDHIKEILNDPDKYEDSYSTRLVVILNALFDEFYDNKVVLFTNYEETFDVYKKALSTVFPCDEVSFFGSNLSTEEIELNAYRFQTQDECRIMLCDYTGGEGRNFQCADYIIHIDLPWDASMIEQRIGRLDRLESFLLYTSRCV